MRRWLILGHGSVGSALTRRIADSGSRPSVFDPSPRVHIEGADHIAEARPGDPTFDRIASCVPPSSALRVIDEVRPLMTPDTLYYDWNTLTPSAKASIAESAPCHVIDVALLDTLDAASENVNVAVSGRLAAAAVRDLEALGFSVAVVGGSCGDAAELKLTRSMFTKTLEALVLEFYTALVPLAGREVVLQSIEKNLGSQFLAFARTLIETDRVHAARRATELTSALGARKQVGPDRLARAAVDVLLDASAAWRGASAPPVGSDAESLVGYLAWTGALDREISDGSWSAGP